MKTFLDDKNLREIIERTVVFYIFRKTLEEARFEGIEFNEFCSLVAERSPLAKIMGEIHAQGIDVSKGGIKQIQSIIKEKFSDII